MRAMVRSRARSAAARKRLPGEQSARGRGRTCWAQGALRRPHREAGPWLVLATWTAESARSHPVTHLLLDPQHARTEVILTFS
eukprot:463688-Pleurochrysis_carterae.AAC.1